jgi:hypothetical protein
MKKLLCISMILSLIFAQIAFADIQYTESDDIVPIELNASFISDGILRITWDEPPESNLETFKLYKSTANSVPNEDYILNSKVSVEYQDEPSDGISYYRMCVYTTLKTRKCGNVVAVRGAWNTVLDPIVEAFNDIEGHWAKQYIEKLRVMNVVQGDGEGNFEPNRNIVRAEAIKILMLTFGIGGTSCNLGVFPDMSANDWFCDVVSKAHQNGYVEGDDGYLLPGREITRAEAVKVVLEIKGTDVPEITEKPFDDVDLEQWYAKYVAKAKELNIVQGVGGGLFEPNRSITRAELSKIAAEAAQL